MVGRLVAPELYFSTDEAPFTTNMESAPVVQMTKNINVSWNPSEGAESYRITLDQSAGNNFTNVMTIDQQQDLNCVLNQELFAGITETTLFRFGISANG